MIFTAQKERDEIGGLTTLTQVKSLAPPYPDVAALVREVGQPLPSDAISGSGWSLTDAATTARLRKMHAVGISLGEYVKGQIYRGVLIGFNKAFIIDLFVRPLFSRLFLGLPQGILDVRVPMIQLQGTAIVCFGIE